MVFGSEYFSYVCTSNTYSKYPEYFTLWYCGVSEYFFHESITTHSSSSVSWCHHIWSTQYKYYWTQYSSIGNAVKQRPWVKPRIRIRTWTWIRTDSASVLLLQLVSKTQRTEPSVFVVQNRVRTPDDGSVRAETRPPSILNQVLRPARWSRAVFAARGAFPDPAPPRSSGGFGARPRRGVDGPTWSSGRLVISLTGFSRLEPVQAVDGLSSAAMAPGLCPAAAAQRRRRRLGDPRVVRPSVCPDDASSSSSSCSSSSSPCLAPPPPPDAPTLPPHAPPRSFLPCNSFSLSPFLCPPSRASIPLSPHLFCPLPPLLSVCGENILWTLSLGPQRLWL